jgi:hypothetical protein
MTTAADRLVALAGGGGTAGVLLLAIGAGATAGAALVNYSGLGSATAAVHLMTDVSAVSGDGGRFLLAMHDVGDLYALRSLMGFGR